MFSKIPALKDFKLNLSGKTLEEHFRSKSSLKISSNINEVIKAVLNSLFIYFFYEKTWKLITSKTPNIKKLRLAH